MTPSRPDIAAALTEAARNINTPPDLDSTLRAIVETAAKSLAGIEHVGISIAHANGKVATRAASDDLVSDLDSKQYELGDGPCLSAMAEGTVVVVDHLATDTRWPSYVEYAAARGVRSQLGIGLFSEGSTTAGLNLYSTSTDVIDPDVQHEAELFATHAAIALGRARREQQLNDALTTRKVVGQALGILMERFDLDEDRAFAYLVRVSTHSNVKLREIAQELVRQRNDKSIAIESN